MDKRIAFIKKGFVIAITYNICVLIMMIENMYLQLSIYYFGLAIIGTFIYKAINFVLNKFNRRISKNDKKQ